MNQLSLTTVSPTEQLSSYRHICGWCHRDLGALWQGSRHHSYAICETCKHTYFAGLYESMTPTAAEPQRPE